MATMPMQMQAPENEASEMEGEESEGGYTICIKVDANGEIRVGIENPESQEMESEEQQEYEDSDLMPVRDIKEALTTALEIFRSKGAAPMDKGAMQNEFASGYKG